MYEWIKGSNRNPSGAADRSVSWRSCCHSVRIVSVIWVRSIDIDGAKLTRNVPGVIQLSLDATIEEERELIVLSDASRTAFIVCSSISSADRSRNESGVSWMHGHQISYANATVELIIDIFCSASIPVDDVSGQSVQVGRTAGGCCRVSLWLGREHISM